MTQTPLTPTVPVSLPYAGTFRRRNVIVGFARRSPLGVFAIVTLAALVVTAIAAPLVAPYDPLEINRTDRLASPNSTYWLGTDSFGRDQFSRIVYGARVSLMVGVVPIAISSVAGTVIGLLCGYVGGWLDIVVQRLMDAIMAFPALVLVLVIVSLLGPTERNVILVLAVVTLPAVSRVARALTLATVGLPFVESARSVGATQWRVILVHVLPNIAAPICVLSASLVGGAILAEASLSFLGLGVPPPEPTWGNMIGGRNSDLFEVAPWLAIFPGLAIVVTVLAFNLLGDTLGELLDPRTRTESVNALNRGVDR